LKDTVLFYLGKEEQMKRLFQILFSLLLALCLFCPMTALADTGGSGNIDGGGGGMGSGSDANYWNSGNEGVRITVVRASDHAVVTTPIDFTNITPPSNIYHFGKVSTTAKVKNAGQNNIYSL
jgi:hypothetical protein